MANIAQQVIQTAHGKKVVSSVGSRDFVPRLFSLKMSPPPKKTGNESSPVFLSHLQFFWGVTFSVKTVIHPWILLSVGAQVYAAPIQYVLIRLRGEEGEAGRKEEDGMTRKRKRR